MNRSPVLENLERLDYSALRDLSPSTELRFGVHGGRLPFVPRARAEVFRRVVLRLSPPAREPPDSKLHGCDNGASTASGRTRISR